MQPPLQHSWVNLAELKTQIIKKLGPERSKLYFEYLNRFLNLKLSKVEFDKLCVRTIGRDGIPLHNQLIRSILKNACVGKVSFPPHHDNKKPPDGVCHQNGSISVATHGSGPLPFPNGDILSPSARKARTGARERKYGDRRAALGPNGKTNYSSPSSSVPHSDDLSTALENGNLSSRGPAQQHQELNQQIANVDERSADGSSGRKGTKMVLQAPLGIPYCPARAPPLTKCVGVSDTRSLLDTITLRARMEPIAAAHGIQGVSLDCANAVNNCLDAYLKGLIRSCSELNGPRSGPAPINDRPAHLSQVNGVRPGWPLDTTQEPESESKPKGSLSLLDFRVAMELNPKQLGEDWPILLEKICTHSFDE